MKRLEAKELIENNKKKTKNDMEQNVILEKQIIYLPVKYVSPFWLMPN